MIRLAIQTGNKSEQSDRDEQYEKRRTISLRVALPEKIEAEVKVAIGLRMLLRKGRPQSF
jgi:hypothetical protein